MSGEAEAAATAVDTAETVQGGNSDKGDPKDTEALDIESRILAAMRSRVTYLREKSDSFTFESVRRLLEEDLGLEKYALDVHKSFVKQHLVQCLEGADNDDASENSLETEKKEVNPVKEAAESPKERDAEKDVKEDATRDDEKMEDSPVMGLLAAEKTNKSVAKETKDEVKKEVQESEIKKALRKRAAYIKVNSEKITMGLLRRLLEKDLKLEKYALDPHKKFINEQLDEVLQSPDPPKGSTQAKGRNVEKKVEKKASQKLGSKESSDSDGEDGEEEEEEEEEENVNKKTARKRKLAKSDGPKKRKREKETKISVKKKAKPTETDSRNGSDGADSEIVSDDGRSQSSSEKPAKPRKEAVNAAYGKQVEHLKSVIRSCGMSVPPAIYRKVKQASEDKREAALIKELEQILAKEGLSSNPSEKEVKEVKKRKERARELEGIDMSNIVSSSRRRSITSFAPPPKPKITEESESDEEDSENEDEDDEEDEEDNEEGNEEAGEESQSEESNDEDDAEEQSE